MTSDRKAEANRHNALKSTGPRRAQGKNAVRLNALKHGLLSREALLPGEDEDALRELAERLRTELQPLGELENLLVDRITSLFWKLRRLGRVEAGIFAWELYGELAKRVYNEARSYTKQDSECGDLINSLLPTTTITDQENHQEAHSKAKEMEAIQDAETAPLGRTFIRDAEGANAFSKLSRYETTTERGLYKALHELQCLQAARAGWSVPPPVTVDIEVFGTSKGDR